MIAIKPQFEVHECTKRNGTSMVEPRASSTDKGRFFMGSKNRMDAALTEPVDDILDLQHGPEGVCHP